MREMQRRIETTGKSFSPLLLYAKLLKFQIAYATLFLFSAFAVALVVFVVGVDIDPFTGRKNFAVISRSFEKGMERQLK